MLHLKGTNLIDTGQVGTLSQCRLHDSIVKFGLKAEVEMIKILLGMADFQYHTEILLPPCFFQRQAFAPICFSLVARFAFGNNTVQQKNTRNTRHENTNLIWCCLTEILQSWAYFSILFGLDFVDILGFIDPSLVNWIPRSQRCQVAPLISPNESHRLTQFTHTLTSLVSSSSRIRAKIVSFP